MGQHPQHPVDGVQGVPAGARHVPVLLPRVAELLAPALAGRPAVLVDATLGLGGHAAALLAEPAAVAECRVQVREAEDEAECALQGLDPDTRVQAVYGYERGRYLGGG